MEARLIPSKTKSAKRRTSKTAKLSPEQSLEILQAAWEKAMENGIEGEVIILDEQEPERVAMVLANVTVYKGNLVLKPLSPP